ALQGGNWVLPTLAVPKKPQPSELADIWTKETFAPVLNVAIFGEIEQAIGWGNAVPQGLSGSLWTRDMRNIGKWIGPSGGDAGIVNVNVGTSGAEGEWDYAVETRLYNQIDFDSVGAAFGGNKGTGWGRESGGDAWKQYVRWSACTPNFSDEAPLAQGVNFGLNSSPYNATLAKNVMDVVEGAISFFTFEEWQKLTPFPFTEASVNLDFEFARIRKTKYKTDNEFNRDLYNLINRLDDAS
ncbi:hypothetical protein FRC11_011711, partial [Ceratobasidium sp. 423]